jgi:hypothetical protein
VRDGDHGLALHQRVKVLLDRRLDFRIERRGRLVEHQDRRVLQEDPRDRDALALAARELHAAFADMGVVAGAPLQIDEAEDIVMRIGALGRGDDVFLGRVRLAVSDVVAHRPVQQRGVLRDDADLRAQRILRHVGDVLTVDQDPPAFQVVEAQQHVHQRRLARARAADKADLLARRPSGSDPRSRRPPCRNGSGCSGTRSSVGER